MLSSKRLWLVLGALVLGLFAPPAWASGVASAMACQISALDASHPVELAALSVPESGYFTELPDHQSFDWSNFGGLGELISPPIWTPAQAEQMHEQVRELRGSSIEETASSWEDGAAGFEALAEKTVERFGAELSAPLVHFMREAQNWSFLKLQKHFPRQKIRWSLIIRTEGGAQVTHQHSHDKGSVTFSKAEMGMNSIYGQRIPPSDRCLVFLDGLHGSPPRIAGEKRLIVLFFMTFNPAQLQYRLEQHLD